MQGEATRVGNERPGFGARLGGAKVASRTSGAAGIGACRFLDGARYQVHVGQ
jgi:hypothetical protein